MNLSAPRRVLLGPQRPHINLGNAVAAADIGDQPVAVISAGWQEAEGDIDDIRNAIDNPLHDLGIYARSEKIFADNDALQQAYRERQDQLIEQQRMYRLRLKNLTIAARAILRADGNRIVIGEERRHAISQLRALDRHHLRQIRKINARFDESFDADSFPALADARAALDEELSGYQTVLITGGNVVVLVNRLRLLGLDTQLRERNLIGWSAGAMVLCDRIVLFHDRMPQGRRDAEVMSEGLGIVPGTILLPNAEGRLRMSEFVRNSLFSRRFSPAACLTLDNGALLRFQDNKVTRSDQVNHISREGKFVPVRAA